jgi:hypothetical protein
MRGTRRALPLRMQCSLLLLLALAGCKDDLLADLPDASVPAPDACVAAGSHIVYLNRSPTTFTPGAPGDSVANVSSIVTAEVTTEGASISETMWRTARTCVTTELAPYDITVTDVDPGDVDHLEIVVTDQAAEIGLAGPTNGVSPFSCPALGPREIGFAFWAPFGKNAQREFCEQLLWVVAVSAGLTDSLDCRDIMWPRRSDDELGGACGEKHFIEELVGCAEQADLAPRDCVCTGEGLQSSHAAMIAHYGASTCAP